MSQSGYILAALLAGFVLYLAAKNRLGTYTSVLWGPAPAAPGGSASSSSWATSGIGGLVGNVASAVGFAPEAAILGAFGL